MKPEPFPPLSKEQERIARELRRDLGLPARPRSASILRPILTIVFVLTVYPLYAALMLSMEAAVFLDTPFRQTWDRIWVRWLLFLSFCWASILLTGAIKALVKWVKD